MDSLTIRAPVVLISQFTPKLINLHLSILCAQRNPGASTPIATVSLSHLMR